MKARKEKLPATTLGERLPITLPLSIVVASFESFVTNVTRNPSEGKINTEEKEISSRYLKKDECDGSRKVSFTKRDSTKMLK